MGNSVPTQAQHKYPVWPTDNCPRSRYCMHSRRQRAKNPNTARSRQSTCKQPNGKRNNKEVTGGHMNNLDPRAQLLEGQTVAFVQALDAQGGSPIYTLTHADARNLLL